ncbi:MAG: SEL1-like repeat protein [Elusimicrobiaceae bacterium]
MKNALILAVLACVFCGAGFAASTDTCSGKYEDVPFKELQKKAEKDNCAQFRLAERYSVGKDCEKDLKKAAEFFSRAANAGVLPAQYALGSLYYYGTGLEQNTDTAVKWFETAAQGGDAYSQMRLGLIYGITDEPHYNPEKSLYWYNRAAEQGFLRAQLALGSLYYKKKDYASAIKWFDEFITNLPQKNEAVDWSAAEGEFGVFVMDAYRDNYSRALIQIAFSTTNITNAALMNENVLKAVRIGSPGAYLTAGDMYYYGWTDKPDFAKAHDFYTRAAEDKLPEALYKLGLMSLKGQGTEKSTHTAVSLLSDSADIGYAPAQLTLGDMYFEGSSVTQDYKTALGYYTRAGNSENSDAQFAQAFMLENGLGCAKNTKDALELYKKAGTAGGKFALAMLGYIYETGVSAGKDEQQARIYYAKAAEAVVAPVPAVLKSAQGRDIIPVLYRQMAVEKDVNSALALGFMYERGVDVKKNPSESVRWYKFAAEKGSAPAQLNLGNAMLAEGRKKDAEKWYRKAADLGSIEAAHNLAWLYYNSAENNADVEKAAVLFSSAAEAGFAESQVMLGNFYLEGLGFPQDCLKAKEWYEKAARHDNPAANAGLGHLYIKGCSVEKNPQKALEFFKKAAEGGNVFALVWLGSLYEKGEALPRNYPAAFRYYSQAAEKGDALAQNKLGVVYYNGTGVTQDYKTAYGYFEKAARSFMPESFYYIGLLFERGQGGLARDNAQAYQWYYICAKTPDSAFVDVCSKRMGALGLNLSQKQIQNARRAADKYILQK